MAAQVLVSGTLFHAPEQRTGKASGKYFVAATIKVRDGDMAQFWKVLAFSPEAQRELLRLDDGDALAVQGGSRAEAYQKDGEPRVSLMVLADAVLPLRLAKNIEAEERCYQIRWRAANRAGELLKEREKATGGDAQRTRYGKSTESPKTLAELGITKQQSSDWQKLATVPRDEFEAALADRSVRQLIDKPRPVEGPALREQGDRVFYNRSKRAGYPRPAGVRFGRLRASYWLGFPPLFDKSLEGPHFTPQSVPGLVPIKCREPSEWFVLSGAESVFLNNLAI